MLYTSYLCIKLVSSDIFHAFHKILTNQRPCNIFVKFHPANQSTWNMYAKFNQRIRSLVIYLLYSNQLIKKRHVQHYNCQGKPANQKPCNGYAEFKLRNQHCCNICFSVHCFLYQIHTQKLEWKAESKIGSLDNATHKAGGGTKMVNRTR